MPDLYRHHGNFLTCVQKITYAWTDQTAHRDVGFPTNLRKKLCKGRQTADRQRAAQLQSVSTARNRRTRGGKRIYCDFLYYLRKLIL